MNEHIYLLEFSFMPEHVRFHEKKEIYENGFDGQTWDEAQEYLTKKYLSTYRDPIIERLSYIGKVIYTNTDRI